MRKPLEWLFRQLGVGRLIAMLFMLMVIGVVLSVISQSWVLAMAWATAVNLFALFLLNVFRGELDTLKTLISHVGNSADKNEVIDASEGLLADIEKPMLKMLRDLSRKESSFDNVVKEIQHSASELSNNASLLSKNTAQQSESTGSTAAAVTEIGHSIEEITSRINEVFESATMARNYSDEGAASIHGSRGVVEDVAGLARETQDQVNQLAEESRSVTQMSKDIVGIADQTSLLALNAAIEAARAGEHGRGFSVVADEVRALAERSNVSATVISEKIENVNECMARVEKSMNKVLERVEVCLQQTANAGEKLNEIAQSSEALSEQISAIATASEQQSVAAREISSHIENVSVTAEENSYMANQTAEISSYLVSLTQTRTH